MSFLETGWWLQICILGWGDLLRFLFGIMMSTVGFLCFCLDALNGLCTVSKQELASWNWHRETMRNWFLCLCVTFLEEKMEVRLCSSHGMSTSWCISYVSHDVTCVVVKIPYIGGCLYSHYMPFCLGFFISCNGWPKPIQYDYTYIQLFFWFNYVIYL